MTGESFAERYEVPVAGGTLAVARAGVPVAEAEAVVLGVHGIASSHVIWRTVARELTTGSRVCMLAPDLRGRGRSAGLPGPYGMAAHVADLLAVLDHAGARQAVVVGHSLGAYVANSLAVQHPQRVSAVVLLDGGLAIPSYPAEIADELVEAMVDSALEMARLPFESIDEHVDQWRAHPAYADDFSDDVEAYARYAVADENGTLRAAISEEAVRADLAELVRDDRTRASIDRIQAPLTFVRARLPVQGVPISMVPQTLLDAFIATHPRAVVDDVADANHYTLVLGAGHGPRRVAADIAAAISQGVAI